jgi:hypothetical protein
MTKLLLLPACLVLPISAVATTVSLSNTIWGPAVFQPGGTTLVANGSKIRVGMITDLTDPVGSFVEMGVGQVRSVGLGVTARPGKVVGSVVLTESEVEHDKFNNARVYLWVYNSVGSATATAQGIFATGARFPVNDGLTGFGDYLIVSATTEITGTVAVAEWEEAQILPGDAVNSLRLVLGAADVGGAVPEVGVSGLVVLGGMGMGLRRRRRG